MIIREELKLDFCDVLLEPQRSDIRSRKDVNLIRNFSFRYSQRTWAGIPIISANMTSITTSDVARTMAKHNMLSCKPKSFDWGIIDDSIIRSVGLEDPVSIYDGPFLCLDVPNAYIDAAVDRVKKIRKIVPDVILIAGNVTTSQGVEDLILAGADIVKIGIGNGAPCSTRIVTGTGVPQFSAVMECSEIAKALGGHIISDGGCVSSGDICKAFGAGASFVMLGSMLSGTDENGTDFYGMSSKRANNEFSGGLKGYRAAEGWEMKIPPKGPIENVLSDIEGGLRSACSYSGAKNLEELHEKAVFVRVNRQANQSLWNYRV